jgi:hypothetical protein
LVVVAVQEPLADAQNGLGSRRVSWMHDRHGALLKAYRIIRVPSLLIVDAKARDWDNLEISPEAIREWDEH